MEYKLTSDIEDLNEMYDLIRNRVRKVTNNFDLYYNAARFGLNNDKRRMSELNYDSMITTYNKLKEINSENVEGLEKRIDEIGSKLDNQLELWN